MQFTFLTEEYTMIFKRILLSLFIVAGITFTGLSQTIFFPITVSDGQNEITLTIGVHEYGTDGFDLGLDILLPPPPPPGAFDARLVWQSESYMRDVRDNLPVQKTYDMLYGPADGQGPIQLSWDPTYVSQLGTFEIVDRITGTLWGPLDMSTTGTLDVSEAGGLLDAGLHIRMTHSIPDPDEKVAAMVNEGTGVVVDFGAADVTLTANVTAGAEVTASYWQDDGPIGGELPDGIAALGQYYWDVSTIDMEFNNGVIAIDLDDLPGTIDPAHLTWAKRGYMVSDWENIGGQVVGGDFVSTVPFNTLSEFAIGIAPVPVLNVDPTELDFGEVFIGDEESQSITVTNIGTDVLTVTNITSDQAVFSVDPTGFTLGVGESQEVEVTFEPDSEGAITGTLTITSNDADSPHTVSLEGIGITPLPSIVVEPELFDETVASGDILIRTLTITNEGDAELTFSLSSDADWIDFNPAGGNVPAGDDVDVTVTFDATDLVVGNYNEDIVVTSNDPDNPSIIVAIDLEVTGQPVIVIDPDELDFGEVIVGDEVILSFTVENNGTDVLNITDISTDHDNFSVDVTELTLGIGESEDVNVTFSPTAAGEVSATVTIASDAPGSPHTVSLEGTGLLPPTIAVNPESFEETVTEGEMVTAVLTVSNEGDVELTYSLSSQDATPVIRLEGRNVIASVDWIGFDPGSGSVPAGEDVDITVTFDASDLTPGTYTAEIVVASNDPVHPQVNIPVELTVLQDLPLPDQVVLSYPADGASVEIPDDALEIPMGWHPSQPEVTNYQLDIALDIDFTDVVFTDDGLTDTVYVFTDLEDNETYYWRVRAENETGWGEYSDIWSFTVLLVGMNGGGQIPEIYSLSQNYPNPFNPSTTIRYGLPERSHVMLEVYNTLGQRVAMLVNEELDAGYYEVVFDAAHLASGVYLYRIQAGDYVRTMKLVLMK